MLKYTHDDIKEKEIKSSIKKYEGRNRLLLLPSELQMKIIVFSQNPWLFTTCAHFWRLGQSTGLRADYIRYRYGPHVLGEHAMRRKIVTVSVMEHLIRSHQCDPKADGDYWVFKYACDEHKYDLGYWIVESSLSFSERSKILGHLCTIAAMKGSIPMVDMLVHRFQADIHQNGELALTMASQENQVAMVMHLYRTYGCDIHQQHERYLRSACVLGYEQLVLFLLSSGADVHAYNDAAIHNAVFKGNASIVKALLEYGANAQANHHSCIRLAVNNGDLEIVHYLVSLGGVDPRFHQDWPLRHACRNGFDDIVRYLLDAIEDKEAVNLQEGLLLEIACKYCRYSLLEILLVEYKADVHSKGMKKAIQYLLKSKKIEHKHKIFNILINLGLQDLSKHI